VPLAKALEEVPAISTSPSVGGIFHSVVPVTDPDRPENLVGRSNTPTYRVLKNITKIPAATKGVMLMVRDAAHIPLLQGEGVKVDSIGRLESMEYFWDFSPECQQKYEDKLAAADGVSPDPFEDKDDQIAEDIWHDEIKDDGYDDDNNVDMYADSDLHKPVQVNAEDAN
jgi:cell division septal protein FtsQ